MAGLDSGINGFNVLNPNGETAPLPLCVLTGGASASLALAAYWSELASDQYSMAVPNSVAGGFGWSAIRTPVSGLYQIDYNVAFTGNGSGVGAVLIYVDKALTFTSSGAWAPGVNNSYIINENRVYLVSGLTACASLSRTVFLEKDCYVSLYLQSGGGTAPAQGITTGNHFSLRCLSADNNPKLALQT